MPLDHVTPMGILLALQAVLGLTAGAAWVLSGPSDAAAVARRLARVALVGATLALGGAFAGRFLFGNGFAAVRLWFHAIVFVLAPLTVLVGALGWRRGSRIAAAASLAAGVAVLVAGWFATQVEPYRLEITRHAIQSDRLPPGMAEPIVVAVLADIQTDHVGAFEERVFAELDALRPDLVLLPGDYLQCASEADFLRERRALNQLFASLVHRPRLGILAVDGDVDLARVSLDGSGAVCLENESVRFEAERLQVIGLTTPASRRDLSTEALESIASFPGLTIVCGHAPDFMSMALEGRLDAESVLVAGHTHGGQVVIPGYGPPLTLSRVPRWLAGGGLFQSGRVHLCVSRGVGMERRHAPRVRFLCRPEIVVLELGGPLP